MLAVPGVYLLYQRQKISDFSEAEPVHRRSFDWMAAAGVCGNLCRCNADGIYV